MGFLRKYCSCACSKSRRPQYKQHVLGVFPKNIEETVPLDTQSIQPQNLSSLVHYAVSYPEQLPSIGRYLHKCISKDLKLEHYQAVKIAVLAMNALIDACHTEATQLILYDQWIIKATCLLLDHELIDLKILACETFRRFIHYQDEWSDYKKLEGFFPRLIALCRFRHETARIQSAVRTAGIESMSKMILFTDAQNSIDHLNSIIPAVLENIRIESPVQGSLFENEGSQLKSRSWLKPSKDEEPGTPENLAVTCLKNIGILGNLHSLERILQPIMQFLDNRQWLPLELALFILRTVADSTKLDHAYYFVYFMLRHMDEVSVRPTDPGEEQATIHRKVQKRIVQVTAELVLQMKLEIGPWQGLINFLLQRLETCADEPKLSEALTKCVLSYCIRLPSARDYLDIIGLIVDQFMAISDISGEPMNEGSCPAELVPKHSESKSKVCSEVLLHCVLLAAQLRKWSTADCELSDRHVTPLLMCCRMDLVNNRDLFVKVHLILQNVAIPFEVTRVRGMVVPADSFTGRRFGDLPEVAIRASSKINTFLALLLGGEHDELAATEFDHFISETQQRWIHLSIHHHLSAIGSSPEHFESYFRTLVVLLRIHPHESLLTAIPMLLNWLDEAAETNVQTTAIQTPSSVSQSMKNIRINLLIMSYIFAVSKVAALLNARRTSSELEDLSSPILKMNHSRATGLRWENQRGLCSVPTSETSLLSEPLPVLLAIDKSAIIRSLARIDFPGMDATQTKEALTEPFDSQTGRMDSPRRQSVSIAQPVDLERSVSISTDSKTSMEDARNEGADACIEDVRISVGNADGVSEAETETGRPSRRGLWVGSDDRTTTTKSSPHAPDSFEFLASSYSKKHSARLNMLGSFMKQKVDPDDQFVDPIDPEPVDLALGTRPESDQRHRSLDTRNSSDEFPGPILSPLVGTSSGHLQPASLSRHRSRSSVLTLPDNPQPVLSAQRMLSDLDESTSQIGSEQDDAPSNIIVAIDEPKPDLKATPDGKHRLSDMKFPRISALGDALRDPRTQYS